MKLLFVFMIAIFASTALCGQNSLHNVVEGNKAYRNQEFDKASSLYRKSLEQKTQYDFQARYNLANSLYRGGDYQGARETYAGLLNDSLDNRTLSRLYHNIGNTYMQEKNYEQSAIAYKNALRYNPSDEDARYNLSYALQMLKKQQQQNQQNQNKDKNKDQNKDQNKDENKDKDKNENKDQQQDQQKNQEQKKNELSSGQADQMLKALQNKEKQTQREIHAQPAKEGQGAANGYKDW
ncbi:Tetratricopeptide repeat protein [anaerobic digester metagenome]